MEVGVATGDMTYAASYKPLVIPAPPDAKVGTFTRTQLEAQATAFGKPKPQPPRTPQRRNSTEHNPNPSATRAGNPGEGRARANLLERTKSEYVKILSVDEGTMPGSVPATVCAIADAIRWAEEILREIDARWPERPS
jgi:hypothetical protein